MEALRMKKMERFCQYIALEDCTPSEAAYRAGYGKNGSKTYKKGDKYFAIHGSKLMKREDVVARINTLREEQAHNDQAFTSSMIDNLKKIITFDTAKYMASSNCELPNGRTVTDYWLKTPIESWDKKDRCLMLNGFDGSGRPKFIDKSWAWEKLLRIYGLDGKEMSVDVEDMFSLFNNAGLPTGMPITHNNPDNDLNSLNKYDEEQRRLEKEADEEILDEEANSIMDNRTLENYLDPEVEDVEYEGDDEYFNEDAEVDDEYEGDEYIDN